MAFEKGRALLIGVDEYIHHPRANRPMAAGDARQLSQALADPDLCGYLPERVILLAGQEASRAAVLQALADLSSTAADNTVLLFYSGHGALGTDGAYYLSACDTRFTGGRISENGISEGELLGLLRQVPARKMILLFHACFSGELSPHFGPGEEEVASISLPNSTADAILASGEGRIIITSSREGQESWASWKQPVSFFGRALIDGLRGAGWVASNAGYIGAFGLYEYVYETVKEAAQEIGQEQEPVLTALQNVGPFPLALYRGASQTGSFNAEEALPEEVAVRRVSDKASRRSFERRVINTGGGAYIEGSVNTGGGDFVGRDQNKVNHGGGMSGGTILDGNRNVVPSPQSQPSAAGLASSIQAIRALLPLAGLDADDRQAVEGDLQVVETQLARPEPKKALVLQRLQTIAEMLSGSSASGIAAQQMASIIQQAQSWTRQL